MFHTKSTLLFILIVLSTEVLSADPVLTKVTWDEGNLGNAVGAIVKVSFFILLLILIIDIKIRLGNKQGLGSGYVFRFIWFAWASSFVWFIGSIYPNGYREFNGNVFGEYMKELYEGYFGSGFLEVFSNPITVNGTKTGWLLQNHLFIELLIFLIIRIAAAATNSKAKQGDPVGNFLNALRVIVTHWLLFYFAFWSIQHYELMHFLGKLDGSDRSHFNVYLAWGFAFYLNVEVVWGVVEIFLAQRAAINPKPKQEYNEAPKQENKENFAFQHQIGNAPAPKKIAVHTNSFEDLRHEIAFQHQNRLIAVTKPLYLHYNFGFLLKNMTILIIGSIWNDKVRTMYWIVCIIDLIWIGITVVARPSLHKLNGWLILASDIMQFTWNLPALIFFTDMGKGYNMKQGWVNFWTNIAFWSFIFSTIIEFVLLFVGSTETKAVAEENLNSDDIRLDAQSNNELDNKI